MAASLAHPAFHHLTRQEGRSQAGPLIYADGKVMRSCRRRFASRAAFIARTAAARVSGALLARCDRQRRWASGSAMNPQWQWAGQGIKKLIGGSELIFIKADNSPRALSIRSGRPPMPATEPRLTRRYRPKILRDHHCWCAVHRGRTGRGARDGGAARRRLSREDGGTVCWLVRIRGRSLAPTELHLAPRPRRGNGRPSVAAKTSSTVAREPLLTTPGTAPGAVRVALVIDRVRNARCRPARNRSQNGCNLAVAFQSFNETRIAA
jgi:hypothetical protein